MKPFHFLPCLLLTQVMAAPTNKTASPVPKTKAAPKKLMPLKSTAISLSVDNVPASSRFLAKHFGFQEKMAAPGFASLSHPDPDLSVIFLRRGITVLPASMRNQRAGGVIVAFVVTDIRAQEARLKREGVKITMPLRTEAWGERLFQVTEPNGIIIELVEWVTPTKKSGQW